MCLFQGPLEGSGHGTASFGEIFTCRRGIKARMAGCLAFAARSRFVYHQGKSQPAANQAA
jgi:hypothetical protein